MSIHLFDSYVQLPGMKFPCRSVLVHEAGRVILFSPIDFSEEQLATIRAIGEVTDLVAPCLFHHLGMGKAIRQFPKARVWGVPGFKEKRPDIAWTDLLTPEKWPYKSFLDIVAIEGAPKYSEADFFHESTRTLLATDLCFNMRRPGGWAAGIILRIFGNYDGFASSRLLRVLVRDKVAFEKSLVQLFQWDFDKVVMAHGLPINSGGKELLRNALRARGFQVE